MSMDMWFIKPKDKLKWSLGADYCESWEEYGKSPTTAYCEEHCRSKCVWWLDTKEDIRALLEDDNFYKNGFDDADKTWTLIEYAHNVLGKKFTLSGDPIVGPEHFREVVENYETWVKSYNGDDLVIDAGYNYIFGDIEQKAFIEYTSKEIFDLAIYLRTALDNGFLLWLAI